MKRLTLAIFLAMLFTGCTQQQRARQFGGSTTETLPQGRKLVLVTWKDDDLWILTRAAKQGETPETYTFSESSSFGVMEGTVTIKEQ